MNWRLKSAIRHAVMALPRGDRLYRWLNSELRGTMSGMAAKWFRVFPNRVAVLQEIFGAEARAQRMWCFDSGATMAAGLAMAVATDQPGLLTDRWDRLSDRYCEVSRRVAREKGAELAVLSHAPGDRVDAVLHATGGTSALAALAAVRMTYSGGHAAADDAEWAGTIGCVFSAGTLEHYTPEQLEAEVARMARALRRGGVMSHVVDHRDHRWHADKGISPLLHLTLDEDEYLRRFDNPLEYHNRWLRSRYVELFARHGFRVECRDVRGYTADLVPLDTRLLAPPFGEASGEDLRSLVTHVIAVRG
jgi:SAM-dependent methyltransferase